MQLKKFFRVIAFDDGAFLQKKGKTILIGVLYRADNRIEGILSRQIIVDGLDSTKKIIEMLKTPLGKQASFILLQGIAFGGFNIADLKTIFLETKIPVIIVFKKTNSRMSILKAVEKTNNPKKRKKLLLSAPKIHSIGNRCFQFIGCSKQTASEVIEKTIKHSLTPEPIRIAHLIASGITSGESTRP